MAIGAEHADRFIEIMPGQIDVGAPAEPCQPGVDVRGRRRGTLVRMLVELAEVEGIKDTHSFLILQTYKSDALVGTAGDPMP